MNATGLSVPALTDDMDVAVCALAYAEAGWYVLPVRRGSKHPGSVVGARWEHQSSRDPKQIVAWFAGTDHGIALHAGRSGALIFDVDAPDKVPEPLNHELIRDDVPYQSTREHEPDRGHYIFTQPADRTIGNSTGKLGKGWGEVRGLNGVIIVEPSHHEKQPEGRYKWLRTGPVPPLPDIIADLLPSGQPGSDAATDTQISGFMGAHNTGTHTHLMTKPIDRYNRLVAAGQSRHDSAVDAACWIAREAAAGLYPAPAAFRTLHAAFAKSIAGERETLGEFAGIVAWAVGQAAVTNPDKTRAEALHRLDAPAEEARRVLEDLVGGADTQPAPTAPPVNHTPLLPDQFWDARPILKHIQTAAHSRQRSAPALLGVLLARVASQISHRIRIPAIVGAPSTLSLITVVLAPSGVGKSTASHIATDLLPAPHDLNISDALPIGSGEGLAEAYFGWVEIDVEENGKSKTKKVKRQVRHNAFFYVDEGQVLSEIGTRKNATLMPTIRSAFSGSTLGQQNATTETRRILPAGSYAIGIVIAMQTLLAGPLLDDAAGGTPQRLLWMPAIDPTIPDVLPEWPGELSWRVPHEDRIAANIRRGGEWLVDNELRLREGHLDLEIAQSIQDEIRAADLPRARGEVVLDALDAHEGLVRLKLAGLLAVLDDRFNINEEDWALAAMIKAASDTTRDGVVAAVARDKLDRQRAQSSLLAQQARHQDVVVTNGRIVDCARYLAKKVWAEPDRWRYSTLRRGVSKGNRDNFVSGIDYAIEQGWIVISAEEGQGDDARQLRPGPVQPT